MSIYDLIVQKAQQGKSINWSHLCASCPPELIMVAVSQCAFWGVEIDDLPSEKLRKTWREIEPMMAITVPSRT